MKKFLLFAILLIFGGAIIAQNLKHSKPVSFKGQAIPAVAIDDHVLPQQPGNFFTHSKATLEDIIGSTRYDAQSNAAIQNRLIVWPDGSISAAWTKGEGEPGYTNRGTGYNYFDGTAWGTAPEQRVETVRSGWPTMDKWNGNGEMVIAHTSVTAPNNKLVVNTRPVKGTGSWTESTIANPTGVTSLFWAKLMTSGPTNNYVHLLALTAPVANGGVKYMGMDGALLYFRSLDGGATWDKSGVILPGMDSLIYSGISADTYSWGTPHGDTIYFGVAGHWSESFIMKSTDNGATWTKIMVLSNANSKVPAGITYVPSFYSGDGAVAVEMDHSGVIHMAFGKGGGYQTGTSKYILVNVNGLIYWNTTMPMVQDSLDLDSLAAHGNLLAAVYNGPNPGDTIIAAPSYRVGLSSHPQIAIDDFDNFYCLYSAVTPGNPSPDPYNYRHIWATVKFHDKDTWSELMDLNEGALYMFLEFAFPNMAKYVLNDNLNVIYQTSEQPGSAVQVTTIAVHNNNYEHRVIPISTFWPTGIGNSQAVVKNSVGQNFPNPVKVATSFTVNLEKQANVIVEVSNVMGQKVMSMDKGVVNSGAQKFTIDCSQFTSGVYFYTVKMNGESFTHKMIIE
ncbi:MAG: T9SS type A sorting domain-containing protein [Bacteroidota bacterium]